MDAMTRRFDAICIDFYGTISAGDREAVEGACARIVEVCMLPISPGKLAIAWGERFFQMIEQSNHEAFRTLYECELASLRATLRAFGEERDPQPFVAELESYWSNPPVYADALDFLDAVDGPIVCVSNADTTPLLTAIAKHRLQFDIVMSSERARCYKPDAAIFQKALDRLRVDPRRVVHVGDSLHSDIGGAAKLGIRTVWLHRENRVHDIGTHEPDHTITDLRQMLDLI